MTPSDWKRLCGLAVKVVGQTAFKSEARILQRLARSYGVARTAYMLAGARQLGWRSLRSLGSKDGLGRRLAESAYWQRQNAKRPKDPQPIARIFAELAQRGLYAAP